MKLFKNHFQLSESKIGRLAIVCSLLLIVGGCGKDSDDGDVINSVEYPVGELALDLYCDNFGLFTETCVLDDPDNPFVNANITNDNKFAISDAIDAGVAADPALTNNDLLKTKVYFWATAQARDPSGENQWKTASALYALANVSCSVFIRDHAVRAYRSILDNYFESVTFFSTDDFGAPFPEVFYPFPLRVQTANELRLGIGAADPACAGTGYSEFMFDPDGGRNDFVARVTLNEWGYVYDGAAGTVIKK